MTDSEVPPPDLPSDKAPDRLLALSDGLFATVLTLLVLDLRIPEAINSSNGNISGVIKWIGPHLFSYLLTFFVTGTFWLAHHRDFDHVIRHDRRLLNYNLLFLLFIGLFPFSTAALNTGGLKDYAFYWAIYAANIIVAGLMLTLTWNYAVSHQLVSAETTPEQCRNITVREITVPFVFLISALVEFLFPQAFLGPFTLLAIPLVVWWSERHFPTEIQSRAAGQTVWSERLWRAGAILPWLLIIGLAVWAMTQ